MSDDRPPTQALTISEPKVIQNEQAAQAALDIMTRGDLSSLKAAERAAFLSNMALGLGLNPLTKPVDLIPGDGGKLIIYWNKGATDQLRAKHNVNLQIIERSNPTPQTYAVTVRATLPNGRQDEDQGVVVLTPNMSPADQANAIMKAGTKAKRRATLSILGLGLLDESEMDTIPLFQQQLNQPRTLSAPAQSTTVVRARAEATQGQLVAPTASQEVQEAVIEGSPVAALVNSEEAAKEFKQAAAPQAAPAPRPLPAAAPAVAKPSAHVMPGKRLPVAPPVVIK